MRMIKMTARSVCYSYIFSRSSSQLRDCKHHVWWWWSLPSRLADISCPDVVSKDALGLVLKIMGNIEISRYWELILWRLVLKSWGRVPGYCQRKYWKSTWRSSTARTSLNPDVSGLKSTLRFNLINRIIDFFEAKNMRRGFQLNLILIPKFWGSHILLGQAASLGTWQGSLWIGFDT